MWANMTLVTGLGHMFWYKRVTMDTKFDYAKMVQEHLDVPSDLDQYQTLIQEVYNLPTL